MCVAHHVAVMLLDLQEGSIYQGELALEDEPADRGDLMGALDRLNDRYGRGTVTLGSAGNKGADRTWSMKRSLLTPQYTTRWADVPVATA